MYAGYETYARIVAKRCPMNAAMLRFVPLNAPFVPVVLPMSYKTFVPIAAVGLKKDLPVQTLGLQSIV